MQIFEWQTRHKSDLCLFKIHILIWHNMICFRITQHAEGNRKEEGGIQKKWKKEKKKNRPVYMIYCRLNGKDLERTNRRLPNEASFDELNISDLN